MAQADHGHSSYLRSWHPGVLRSVGRTPRVRWNTNLASAGFNTALLIFLIVAAGEATTLDRTTLDFIVQLPGWLLWIGQAIYVVGVLYAFALLIVVFARGRLELLRDMLLVVLLAVLVVLLLTQFIDEQSPSSRSSSSATRGRRSWRSSSPAVDIVSSAWWR